MKKFFLCLTLILAAGIPFQSCTKENPEQDYTDGFWYRDPQPREQEEKLNFFKSGNELCLGWYHPDGSSQNLIIFSCKIEEDKISLVNVSNKDDQRYMYICGFKRGDKKLKTEWPDGYRYWKRIEKESAEDTPSVGPISW